MNSKQELGFGDERTSAPRRKSAQIPKVHARMAMTVDGKLSMAPLPLPAEKAWLALVRSPHTAILAGEASLTADTLPMGKEQPRLCNGRAGDGLQAEPRLVVISNTGRCSATQGIFHRPGRKPIVLSITRMTQKSRIALAPLCYLHLFDSPGVPLRAALALLRSDYGVRTLLCENGGEILQSLAAEGLLDEIHLTIAPLVSGGADAPTLTGLPAGFLSEPLAFRIAKIQSLAGGCRLHLKKTPTGR